MKPNDVQMDALGSALDGRMLANFEEKVVRITESGCWIWTGSTNNMGYGIFTIRRSPFQWKPLAHRFSWMVHKGPIPPNKYLCHTCDVPACCNPEHLFIGDSKTNVQDMYRKGRNRHWSAAKTHCKHGHAYTEESTRHSERYGRICKTCQMMHMRALRADRRLS